MYVEDWFCCLNTAEQVSLRTCASSYVLTAGLFVPASVFDIDWLLAGNSAEARKAAFLSVFWLKLESVSVDPTADPISAYTFNNPALWAEIVAYVFSPLGSCVAGCPHVVYP